MILRVVSALFLAVFLFSSCSRYNRIQKGTNMDAKFDLAVKLYEKGDYFKALPLLEELITVYRGTKKAEKTYYYYAYTNYQLGDFVTAAYDFENFAKTFPNSEFAEECAFMHAYCFYQDSPQYSLDQSNTYRAINELQLFADRNPKSKRLEQCNNLIDQLRAKLELKAYEQAILYYHMDEYRAAITTFKNLLKDFPSTKQREDALFKILESSYRLAENSVEAKKEERYADAMTAYYEFIAAFPESRQRRDADRFSNNIKEYQSDKESKELSIN